MHYARIAASPSRSARRTSRDSTASSTAEKPSTCMRTAFASRRASAIAARLLLLCAGYQGVRTRQRIARLRECGLHLSLCPLGLLLHRCSNSVLPFAPCRLALSPRDHPLLFLGRALSQWPVSPRRQRRQSPASRRLPHHGPLRQPTPQRAAASPPHRSQPWLMLAPKPPPPISTAPQGRRLERSPLRSLPSLGPWRRRGEHSRVCASSAADSAMPPSLPALQPPRSRDRICCFTSRLRPPRVLRPPGRLSVLLCDRRSVSASCSRAFVSVRCRLSLRAQLLSSGVALAPPSRQLALGHRRNDRLRVASPDSSAACLCGRQLARNDLDLSPASCDDIIGRSLNLKPPVPTALWLPSEPPHVARVKRRVRASSVLQRHATSRKRFDDDRRAANARHRIRSGLTLCLHRRHCGFVLGARSIQGILHGLCGLLRAARRTRAASTARFVAAATRWM